ncbi:hypothetical protein [Streptomyces sp. NPDC052042]|uniref:hypothetical protein n=1 Tax=Streptomyces sp. NPDC052042 TaxID=3365683 RepID=UPI0037D24DC1
MSIVADQRVRPPGVRAGLAEEARRWEDEDDARGYEPEARMRALAVVLRLRRGRAVREDGGPVVVTRTVLPGRRVWELETGVPALPFGYVAAPERSVQGSDEIRIRHLMIAAIARFGWAR